MSGSRMGKNEVFVSILEESLSLQDLGGAEHGTSVCVPLGELSAQHANTFVAALR